MARLLNNWADIFSVVAERWLHSPMPNHRPADHQLLLLRRILRTGRRLQFLVYKRPEADKQ